MDRELLGEAHTARGRLIDAEHDADQARAEYHYAIRRLRASGGSMREIAGELGLSHQRVHQIVDEVQVSAAHSTQGRSGASGAAGAAPAAEHYERMSADAREALLLGQEEAISLDHGQIGTEHLLLGLLGVEQGVAARVLTGIGVAADDARSAVGQIIGCGQQPAPTPPLRLTPRSKKVLDLAYREAKRDRSTHLRSEHLLRGLLREGKGVGAQVLVRLGAGHDEVRRRLGHAALACSFCARTGAEVTRLVAGPGVHICDRCIAEATALLGPDPAAEPVDSPLTVVAPDDRDTACGFCRTTPGPPERLVTGTDTAICGRCLALAMEVEADS